MGTLKRIRWQNVARLAAGAAGVVALATSLPGLLRPPDPPAVPSDVGLPRVAFGTPAQRPTLEHDSHPSSRPPGRRPAERERRAKPSPAPTRGNDRRPRRRGDSSREQETSSSSLLASAPAPAPASPSAVPPTPPPPAPAATSSPPPQPPPPPQADHPNRAPEFGFER